jgi:hypothetical protein
MGKASSAKKVARAARAGGNRRPGQRRQLGFPVLITLVVVAGISLVVFARENREANAAPLSQANAEFDHWHAAIGISDCGSFVFDGSDAGPFFTDALEDPQGIHTHGDGIIHIHPFLDSAGGRNARMQIFFDDIGLVATDSVITFPDGTVWDEAEKQCGEGDDATAGQIVIARWNSAQSAADGERPSEIITEDFGDTRFRNDREYFTIAYVPEGEFEGIPVRPDVIATLNNLSDVPPDENIEAPDVSTTATTAADGSSTSTTSGEPSDASTTTTVADEGTTTTAAG